MRFLRFLCLQPKLLALSLGAVPTIPPSLTGQTQNQDTLSLPTSQQETKAVKHQALLLGKKTPEVFKLKLKLQSTEPAVSW